MGMGMDIELQQKECMPLARLLLLITSNTKKFLTTSNSMVPTGEVIFYITCPVCGVEFKKPSRTSRIKRIGYQCCSRDCGGKACYMSKEYLRKHSSYRTENEKIRTEYYYHKTGKTLKTLEPLGKVLRLIELWEENKYTKSELREMLSISKGLLSKWIAQLDLSSKTGVEATRRVVVRKKPTYPSDEVEVCRLRREYGVPTNIIHSNFPHVPYNTLCHWLRVNGLNWKRHEINRKKRNYEEREKKGLGPLPLNQQ